jgi:hypothetical protein
METLNDVIHFYAITRMIENTWGNDKRNLKKHFRDISEKYGSVKGMCLDRYLSLRSAFNPSIQEILDICDLLRQAFISFVSGVHLVVIDEFVMAYQPRKEVKAAEVQGEPIPVVITLVNHIQMNWRYSLQQHQWIIHHLLKNICHSFWI